MKRFTMKLYDCRHTWILGILLLAFAPFACERSENHSGPMSIHAIYLQNVNSNVPDRLVEFVRLGQTIRIEGSGFLGVQRIYINGYLTSFNPALLTDNNIWVTVAAQTPTLEADPEHRNTIVLEKDGQRYVYEFDIRSSAPTITRISHTLPQAGERITVYGSGLQAIESVTFPGGIVVTDGIVSDEEEGLYFSVPVPSGVSSDGGPLLVMGPNGGAYSPAYFNFRKGLVHNFDEVNNHSWSDGRVSANLTAPLPAAGIGPRSQGTYRALNPDGLPIAPSDAPGTSVSRYWINNEPWGSILSNSVIPATTSTDLVGVQMDIYVEGQWNSGTIRFVVVDGAGATRYAMVYAPWQDRGGRVPFENPGHWFTVTMPFSDSGDFEGKTFADVLAGIASATYKQSGPWLENGPINDIPAEETSVTIYFDNIRVVPLHTPVYSDFE